MTPHPILSQIASTDSAKQLWTMLNNDEVRRIVAKGLHGSSAAMVLAALFSVKKTMPDVLAVMNDEDEAGYFYHDLTQMLASEQVLFFPSSYKRVIKNNQQDAGNEILRTEVFTRLMEDDRQHSVIVVTYPAALAETVMSKQQMQQCTFIVKQGESYDIMQLEKKMTDIGFQRTDYVYEPGQFAVRGSIVDVYSFANDTPYRIDFFGDEIDSIRTFDVQSQLSLHRVESLALTTKPTSVISSQEDDCQSDDAPTLKDFIETPYIKIAHGIGFVYDKILKEKSEGSTETVHFSTQPQPLFHKNFDLVQKEFSRLLTEGYTISVFADSEKQITRLEEILHQHNFTGVNYAIHEGFVDNEAKRCYFTDHQIFDRYHKYSLKSEKARKGKVALTLKEIQQFELGDYVVHIDHGVGRFCGLVRVPQGDPAQGKTQEMIKIAYQNDDTVYVSIHALHKVSKYKGKEGEPPRLNRIGSGAWERMKERVKTKVKDIARDLIKLYAQRMCEKGFAYTPDSYLQHELEASFMYEDTPDQLRATQDVKADMEKERPMDRLVCGDVGFGKTEVAIRAAFKAVCDSKQVAVMVPTTVLAYQHYQTFIKRLKDFPVNIDYLTRAKTGKKKTQTLANIKEGKTDIIIGTHTLIGKQVEFKDLGLLIIDEEQKFGVAVKEKLRQIKVNVDTLTMTATPIPRTLQFSLLGARDLSIIQTPPPNRHPISTEIHTMSAELLSEAINFEMSRNGQVFIVNDKINNLSQLAHTITEHVPDARVCIGHGQMPTSELEQVILDFMNYDYDVLISTTIVENGIDVPNANTIIINNAHYYGLSDLHQMRGRVGRSNRKAYCYLIAPPLDALNETTRRRLQAVENFSDLGSGIHIAMQDLDIRGAGNLLGAEQSGFITDLGYETYQKILNEAVEELKESEFADIFANEHQDSDNSQADGANYVTECNVESDLPAYFPEEYVPTSAERMSLYREMNTLTTQQQLNDYKTRLVDRFGQVPEEGEELLRVVQIKWIAQRLGVEKVIIKTGRMILYFTTDSRYYQSKAFSKVLNFLSNRGKFSKLREGDRRSLFVPHVSSMASALYALNRIETSE